MGVQVPILFKRVLMACAGLCWFGLVQACLRQFGLVCAGLSGLCRFWLVLVGSVVLLERFSGPLVKQVETFHRSNNFPTVFMDGP